METNIPQDLKLRFKTLVAARSGLYFKDYHLMDLERAILYRMNERKIDSPLTYFNLLAFTEEKEDEFRELLNCLTVNHTYFFRNEPQFKLLKQKILPEILARKNENMLRNYLEKGEKPSLRIWSAGCSTGEEPYSVAIVIREAIPDLENWDVQIVATDASNRALEIARKGTYGQNSMRLVSKERKNSYFIERKGIEPNVEYEVKDEMKKIVRYGYLNLMEECYPAAFDIILCCNVTIYFENQTTIAVMDKIYHSLNDEGYLLVGPSESLRFISDRFRMFDWEDAIYYHKCNPRENSSEVNVPVMQTVEVSQASQERPREELEVQLGEFNSPEADPGRDVHDLIAEATENLHAERYYVALELIAQARKISTTSVEIYYLEAEALSSLGRFEEAKHRLKTAFALNPLFAPVHYLLGFLFIQEGRIEEAKRSFKKALYLNKDFTLAHFGLANIYKSEGKTQEAIREYRNILDILAKQAPGDIVAYSGGFSAVAVVDACKINIERLKTQS